jgi:hypothetical protein
VKVLFQVLLAKAKATKTCVGTGLELRYCSTEEGIGKTHPATATLDHKKPLSTHPHLAYDPANLQWVSSRFSRIKNDHTPETVAMLFRALGMQEVQPRSPGVLEGNHIVVDLKVPCLFVTPEA